MCNHCVSGKPAPDVVLLLSNHARYEEQVDQYPDESDEYEKGEDLQDRRSRTSKIKPVSGNEPEKKPQQIGSTHRFRFIGYALLDQYALFC